MDVKAYLSVLGLSLILSSCSQNTASTVFPENSSLGTSSCKAETIQNRFIVRWKDGSFSVHEDLNADEFTKNFINPNIDKINFVEFDKTINAFDIQESTTMNTSSSDWGNSMIKTSTAWSSGFYGQGILIGIVDSVVDYSHPQISPRLAINSHETPDNGIDDDGNGVVDDYYGAKFISGPDNGKMSPHGTHVAGIIAADPRYGTVKGVAPQAKIIPAQFIGNSGGGTLGDAVLAVQYAASRGAKIINASWGGAPCVTSLKDAFYELEKKGILIVVAAGNDAVDIDYKPTFPAAFNYRSQITVAASTETDFLAGWSNNGFNLVQIAAPGSSIFSTVPGGTAFFDGTSMAAPFVTGAAALLWSARPNASAFQIRQALLEGAESRPNHEFKVLTRGRLNIERALARLFQLAP